MENFGTLYRTDGMPDGAVYPKNGTDFKWEELHEFVNGYIGIIELADGYIMVINEDGKPQGLPRNDKATHIFRNNYATHDYIVGNALICKSEMVK